jgi:hypothetical protein
MPRAEIRVIVRGGLVQDIIGIPRDTVIIVVDYDCVSENPGVELDSDGDPCTVSVWESL